MSFIRKSFRKGRQKLDLFLLYRVIPSSVENVPLLRKYFQSSIMTKLNGIPRPSLLNSLTFSFRNLKIKITEARKESKIIPLVFA